MTIEQKLDEIKRLQAIKEEYLNMLDICSYSDLCIIDECSAEIRSLKVQIQYQIDILTEKTCSGYIVGYARYNGYRVVKTYIKSRYNGRNKYTFDCVHARTYSTKKAAAAAADAIRKEGNTPQ